MTDRPTRAVEHALRAIHAALQPRFPDATLTRSGVFQHREDEELGIPPLYERLSLRLTPAGYPAWCSSDRDGAALEGIFAAHHDARDPHGPHALVFDRNDRAALRAHGWRGTTTWQARWSPADPARVAAALAVLADLSPRVLLPADLPPDTPWPWGGLVYLVLLADLEGLEGRGEQQILRTRLDDETHRVSVPEGSPADHLRRWWSARPPALRPHAQWLRDRAPPRPS